MATKVSSVNAKIGARLKHYRIQFDKTQTEAGKLIGLTQGTYARMEQGRITIKVDQLLRLAFAYGISAARFLDDIP